jgi:hypothetical protein
MKPTKTQGAVMAPLINDPLHWGLLMDYVAVERDRIVSQLLSCSESELKSIQGEHKALGKLEGLAANLKTEESNKRRST